MNNCIRTIGTIGCEIQYIYKNEKPGSTNRIRDYNYTNNLFAIDFGKKEHYLIIAKSGSGKSYLIGVIAEAIISVMDNYGLIIVDPMGILYSLGMANDPNNIDLQKWNKNMPRCQILPEKIEVEIWIPKGDKKYFEKDQYDKCFSLKANELSTEILCHIFELEGTGLQASLYRKARRFKQNDDPDYLFLELFSEISDNYEDWGFTSTTKQALLSKMDILISLGIISSKGISVHELVKKGKVVVLDTSMSEDYTQRAIVNFLAERLLKLRKQSTRKLDRAKIKNTKIIKPEKYISPVMLLIDEAHNFLPHNKILKKYIKEGRNCGCMLTAISQSPDLDKNTYANIIHLFIGQMTYKDDITAVQKIIPVEINAKQFRIDIKSLEVGNFKYFNIKDKIGKNIRVRARKSYHPAETNIYNEEAYFIQETELDKFNKMLQTGIDLPINKIPKSLRYLIPLLKQKNEIQIINVEGKTLLRGKI